MKGSNQLKTKASYFDEKVLRANTNKRLFCFPYAGGSAAIYHHWSQLIQPQIAICPAYLPGRGARFSETPIDQIDCLTNELLLAITPYTNKPYAFFGHSMGALIAYELTRKIANAGLRQPEHLFVSGRQAPHLLRRKRKVHILPEVELKEELKKLKGTPQEVLDSAELMELMLPLLRADFKLVETYQYKQTPPLSVPTTAFTGTDDVDIPLADVIEWEKHTNNHFNYYEFVGDHFFINQASAEICKIINKMMCK